MSSRLARGLTTGVLIAVLLAVCAGFWWDCLFGPNTPLAAGFQAQMEPWASEADLPGTDRQWSPLLWDGVAQFYPWRLHLGRSMSEGEFALWNPHQMCGYPFVGNGQSALFYPPNWLLGFVNVEWGMGLLAALHYALAAILTALLCRTLGLGYLPAAFGGIAFAFGGFIVTWTELPTLMNAATWLPGALLGVALVFSSRRWGFAVLGISLAMTLLAGHFQIAVYVWTVAGTYALGRVGWALIKRRPTKLAPLAAGVGLALLLAAPQVLPSLELIANSPRGHANPSQSGWELHRRMALKPWEWITFLDPDAFGNPAHGDHQLTRYGTPYSEHCGFVGVITLLLAGAGAYFSRTRHYVFFAVLAALTVHIAMAGPLAKNIYLYVPKLGQAGSFARVLSVFTFAAAMAGALGLNGICAHLDESTGADDEQGICPWNLSPATGLCAAALLILCWELLPWAHGFLPKTRREHVYPVTPGIQRLQRADGRVLAVTPRREWSMARTPAAVLPPNAATVYGYDSISGYDSLMLSSYRALMLWAEDAQPAPAANGNMLLPEEGVGVRQSVMGLSTVMARRRPRADDARDWGVASAGSHGGVGVWTVDAALPGAFMGSLGGPLKLMRTKPISATDAVTACVMRRTNPSAASITLPRGHGADRLFVSETFHPGWSAYSGGERREISPPRKYPFMHVDVREADSEVHIVFEPATVQVGCFLAMIGMSLLAAVVIVRRPIWRDG